MINSYEIKNINGEEILYIHIDLNNEFARFNFGKKDRIISVIKKFIKDNKIKFMGTTACLIVGGMLIGNVKLDNKIEEPSVLNNTLKLEERVSDLSNEVVDDFVIEDIIEESVQDKEESIENSDVNTTRVNESTDENEKITLEKNYVTIRRSNGVVLELELEEYVFGVVAAEMPASFHENALMAQAVIARTYALNAKEKGRVLTDSNSTQNYKSDDELKAMWNASYDTYYNKIKNAVKACEGIYLSYDGKYIEAVYHSTSNGMTEASVNVWGNYYPYLISVDSPYDSINSSYEMEKIMSYEELSSKLRSEININTDFNILSKTTSNRVETIEVNGKVYKGTEFRNILGLRSTDFDILKEEAGVIIKTRGYGHGVGMSQYGANGMAKNGYSYTDILLHYYPGTTTSHL